MTNLIDNGLKFGATVTVVLNRDAAGDIIIHVLDEGPGILRRRCRRCYSRFIARRTRAIAIPAAPARAGDRRAAGQPDERHAALANRPRGGLDASVRLAAQGLYPAVSPAQIEN